LPIKRIEKLRNIDKLLDRVIRRNIAPTKDIVLQQFDRTAKYYPKRAARVAEYGAQGTLRQSISEQSVFIQRPSKDIIIGTVLMYSKLPPYYKTQEEGFHSGQYHWNQDFLIIGYRPENKPSHRGDLLILRSPRSNESFSKSRTITIYAISHTEGMKARKFLAAGRFFLRNEVKQSIISDIHREIRKIGKKR